MIQVLKKSWATTTLFLILACFLLPFKKPDVEKPQSEHTIVVDRLVNTLVC